MFTNVSDSTLSEGTLQRSYIWYLVGVEITDLSKKINAHIIKHSTISTTILKDQMYALL